MKAETMIGSHAAPQDKPRPRRQKVQICWIYAALVFAAATCLITWGITRESYRDRIERLEATLEQAERDRLEAWKQTQEIRNSAAGGWRIHP